MQSPIKEKASGQFSNRGCFKVLLLVGILCVLLIGGCGVLAYFGIQALHEEAEAALGRNPVILEHIGMIKDLDPNYADFPDSGDGDDLSYMIEGTKGVGRVRFKSGESDNQFVIQSGTLEMSSGEVYELVPPQGQDH